MKAASDAKRDDSGGEREFGAGGERRDGPGYGESVDYAYGILRQQVLDGRLPAGKRLIETALADHMRVSRTPVREAIQRLIVDGFVERLGARGVVVVELTAEEIEDVYVTRAALEGLAARLAAQRMSDHEHVLLQEIQDQMGATLEGGDPTRMALINFEFHTEILRLARNTTLLKFMGQVHDALRRYGTTTLSLPDRASRAMAEHRDLLDALMARDGDAAEHIARTHIEGALQARLRLLARHRLSKDRPI